MFKSVHTVVGCRVAANTLKPFLKRFKQRRIIFDNQGFAFVCCHVCTWSEGFNMYGDKQLQVVLYPDDERWDKGKVKLQAELEPMGLYLEGQFGIWTIVK